MIEKPIVPREIKKIYDGRVFSVVVEQITLPKGHTLQAEIVRHLPSVVIAPVTAEGDVILVRQYRHAIGRWLWELPAGSLKQGEEPEPAAIRECHEEVGLIPGKLERLGAFFPTPGYCDEEMIVYKATALREPGEGDTAEPDEDEDIEARAFALDDVLRMIAAGEISDLKTVAAVYLLRR
jgi:ADP-ribose pyrophosphatase